MAKSKKKTKIKSRNVFACSAWARSSAGPHKDLKTHTDKYGCRGFDTHKESKDY